MFYSNSYVFQMNQLGIGPMWRKLAEIGQKWDFIALLMKFT